MNMGILKVDDLTREFRMGQEIIRALDDISFSVEQGEFVTIMGSSGSGKSTLLNILGCLDTATSGDYEIDQRKTRNLTKDQLAKIRNKNWFHFSIVQPSRENFSYRKCGTSATLQSPYFFRRTEEACYQVSGNGRSRGTFASYSSAIIRRSATTSGNCPLPGK